MYFIQIVQYQKRIVNLNNKIIIKYSLDFSSAAIKLTNNIIKQFKYINNVLSKNIKEHKNNM